MLLLLMFLMWLFLMLLFLILRKVGEALCSGYDWEGEGVDLVGVEVVEAAEEAVVAEGDGREGPVGERVRLLLLPAWSFLGVAGCRILVSRNCWFLRLQRGLCK